MFLLKWACSIPVNASEGQQCVESPEQPESLWDSDDRLSTAFAWTRIDCVLATCSIPKCLALYSHSKFLSTLWQFHGYVSTLSDFERTDFSVFSLQRSREVYGCPPLNVIRAFQAQQSHAICRDGESFFDPFAGLANVQCTRLRSKDDGELVSSTVLNAYLPTRRMF